MRKHILLILLLFIFQSSAFSADEAIHTGTIKMTGDMYLIGSASFTGASWLYQSDPDSTTAFQILSSSGGSIVTVDTDNARMAIGTSLLDEVLVLGGNGPGIHIISSNDSDQDIAFEINTGSPTEWIIRHAKSSGANPNGLSIRQNTLGQVIEFTIDGNFKTFFGRAINETIYGSTDTIETTDDVVWGDTLNGDFTLTLHDGTGGQLHTITNSGNEGNALTIASDGSDTIDGGVSLVLYDGETADIKFNSTDNEWRP